MGVKREFAVRQPVAAAGDRGLPRQQLTWQAQRPPERGRRAQALERILTQAVGKGVDQSLQPFSQKSRTPTVAKEFQTGLYDPTEADLEHFRNCCSEGFLGERLYAFR